MGPKKADGDTSGIPRERVEQQLRRIAESTTFAGGDGAKQNALLADILAYIVTQTLDGKPISETHLLLDYFGVSLNEHYGNSNARRTVVECPIFCAVG